MPFPAGLVRQGRAAAAAVRSPLVPPSASSLPAGLTALIEQLEQGSLGGISRPADDNGLGPVVAASLSNSGDHYPHHVASTAAAGTPPLANPATPDPTGPSSGGGSNNGGGANILLIILPLLIVLSTLLFLILVFLIFVIFLKRKSRIRLGEDGGPVDLSVGDGVWGEGGVDGVEARWVEQQDDDVRRGYQRAKDWQLHHPPSSVPSDITLSQFLTIQEKGVSAWSFEPDYESNMAVYVQGRTEITFLDGPGMPAAEGGGNSVLANLPLPKINEVYYFECKMYEKPDGSDVAVGLATKPYPSFRLPGLGRHSVAYGSDGFRTHNYPFTAHSYGPPLREGDVLGVGYRPRSGTVFFTRNGRKHEDCFVGLQRFNLFPCVGASGPATIHVNLGQAGFVFIEANVKKWGLAPSIGTLAPPPAYGSERGSILLESGFIARSRAGTGESDEGDEQVGAGSGGGRSWMSASSLASGSSSRRPGGPSSSSAAVVISSSQPRRTSHRSRRPKPPSASTTPVHPSPLRSQALAAASGLSSTMTPRSSSPVAGPGPSTARRAVQRASGGSGGEDDSAEVTPYISPVDRSPAVFHPPADPYDGDVGIEGAVEGTVENSDDDGANSGSDDGSTDSAASLLLPHNPPTPNLTDISLQSLRTDSFFGHRPPGSPPLPAATSSDGGLTPYSAIVDHRTTRSSRTSSSSHSSTETARPSTAAAAGGPTHLAPEASQTSPPGYSPLDPVVYASGVPTDLPASVISAAFEAEDRAEAAARVRAAAAGAAVLASAEGDAGRVGAAVGGGVVDNVLRWWRGGPQGADASPA